MLIFQVWLGVDEGVEFYSMTDSTTTPKPKSGKPKLHF